MGRVSRASTSRSSRPRSRRASRRPRREEGIAEAHGAAPPDPRVAHARPARRSTSTPSTTTRRTRRSRSSARSARSSPTGRSSAASSRPTAGTPSPICATSWRGPTARSACPLVVRLVKGAYWDYEDGRRGRRGLAAAGVPGEGGDRRELRALRPSPRRPRGRGPSRLRQPQPAQHRVRRSRTPERAGSRPTAVEHQLLYGMAEPVHAALVRLGFRVRVYAPVGELVAGMAYLVRRLLENTSNESFVRHRFAEGQALDALVARARRRAVAGAGRSARAHPDAIRRIRARSPTSRSPSCGARRVRDRLVAAVGAARLGFAAPLLIDGRPVATAGEIVSRRSRRRCDRRLPERSGAAGRRRPRDRDRGTMPGRRGARRRGASAPRSCSARPRSCAAGAPSWRRSRCSRPASRSPRPTPTSARRSTSASTTGARRSASPPARRSSHRRARANAYRYQPRGVGVVISPWNFPLAIPTGMVTAALVTGNCVVFKPAEQTPGIALRLVEMLHEAGVPAGVLALLPGVGEEIGPTLVEHPTTAFVAFTGSKAVGLSLIAARGRPPSGAAAREARHRRDGRQERDRRRRRRRPRRGGAGDRRERVRLRRTEVLGGVARDRRRMRCSTSSSSGWPARPRSCRSGTRASSRTRRRAAHRRGRLPSA